MAEEAMIPDQAMDLDSNAPPALPTNNRFPAATNTSRNPLLARRNISNPRELRASLRESHKVHSSARIQKSSSSPSNTAFRKIYNANSDEKRDRAIRRSMRKLQVARAIADGSFQIPLGTDPAAPGEEDQRGQVEQLRRLDATLVAAGLFEPVPGMTFDRAAPCAFTSDQALMADLVQALEAFQMHLARKESVVLSHKAGGLLRGLARDVLSMAMLRPDRPGVTVGVDEFWAAVARDYPRSKKYKWLAGRIVYADPYGRLMPELSLAEYVGTVLEAVECPDMHPDIMKFLGPAIKDMPRFIVAQPSTLQALMNHYETARVRYLADLKNDHSTIPSYHTAFHQSGAAGFGKLSSGGDGQYDSSDDEDDGPRGGMFDGGAEDDGQVAEGVPSDLGQWFLAKLDKFTASKSGEQQGGVDGDMLSALDLGGVMSNL